MIGAVRPRASVAVVEAVAAETAAVVVVGAAVRVAGEAISLSSAAMISLARMDARVRNLALMDVAPKVLSSRGRKVRVLRLRLALRNSDPMVSRCRRQRARAVVAVVVGVVVAAAVAARTVAHRSMVVSPALMAS
jgi:hypothetical protein